MFLTSSAVCAWDFRDEVYTCTTGGMSLAEWQSAGVTLISHVPCTKEWMDEAAKYGIRGMPYISLYKVFDAPAAGTSPRDPFWDAVDMTHHPEWVYIGRDGQRERPFNNAFYPKAFWQSCTNTAGIADAYCQGAAADIKAGAGGVFIDNVLPSKVCFGPKFGVHQHLYPDQDNIYSFKIALGRVRKTIKGLGPNNAVMLNVGQWDLWQGFGDCIMLESFIYNVDVRPGPGGWVGKDIVRVKDWPQILKWIKETASYVDGSGSIVTLEYLPADPEAAYYTYACAKLGNYLWSGSMPVRHDAVRTLYRCRMQRASGPLQETGGVYFRHYPNGLAAVNTTSKEAVIQVPSPSGCKELADVWTARKSPLANGQVELRIPAEAGRLYVTPQQLADDHLREVAVALETAAGAPGADDGNSLKPAIEAVQEARKTPADEAGLARLCRNLDECERPESLENVGQRLAGGPKLAREEARRLVSPEAGGSALACEVASDRVILTAGKVRWEIGKPGELVRAGKLGASCAVSIEGLHATHGWLAPDKIEGPKVLADTADRKVVEITTALRGAKTKEVIPDIRFELMVEARRGEAGLRLRSAVRNTGAKDIACYFNWSTQGAGTWCSWPGQPGASSDKYANFGKSDWMYVHPSRTGGAGVLVVTDLPQSYGPFACNIYSEPRAGKLAPGAEREIDFDLYLVPATWRENPSAMGAFKRAQVYASKVYSLAASNYAQIRLTTAVTAGRKAQAALCNDAGERLKPTSACLLNGNGDAVIECPAEVANDAVAFTIPASLRSDQFLQLALGYQVNGVDGKPVPLLAAADIRPQPCLSLAAADERATWNGASGSAALVITNHLEKEAACSLTIEAPEGFKASGAGKIRLGPGAARTAPVTITAAQASPPPKDARALLRLDPPGALGEQELPLSFVLAATCPRLPNSPAVDGRLDDEAWKNAATIGPFLLVRDGAVPKESTTALVGYDDRYLYIAFRCSESQMKALAAKAASKPGVSNPAVHADDSVEVFISPKRNREYIQLAANSLGAQKMSKPVQWDVACAAAEKGWTVEMRIELSGLGAVPKPGDTWAVNLCRMEQRLKEATAWSPTGASFHQPDKFGLLTFGR